jgi:MFS family permease
VKPLLDPPPDRVAKPIRIAAFVLASYIAAVHLALAQDRFELDSPYVGAMFFAAALGLVVGAGIAAGGDRFGTPVVWAGWLMAAIAAAGAFAGFLLSRTTTLLPSYHRDDWPVIQLIALACEVVYLALFVVAARALRSRGTGVQTTESDRLAA